MERQLFVQRRTSLTLDRAVLVPSGPSSSVLVLEAGEYSSLLIGTASLTAPGSSASLDETVAGTCSGAVALRQPAGAGILVVAAAALLLNAMGPATSTPARIFPGKMSARVLDLVRRAASA